MRKFTHIWTGMLIGALLACGWFTFLEVGQPHIPDPLSGWKIWNDVLDKSPDNHWAWSAKGRMIKSFADTWPNDEEQRLLYEAALDCYANSLYYKIEQRIGGQDSVMNNMGNVYYRMGDTKTALKYLLAATRINPHNPAPYWNLARITAVGGDIDSAIQMTRDLTESFANIAFLRTNLAAMYELKGDYEAAEQYYRSATEINPDDKQARSGLARIIGQRKKEGVPDET